MNLFLNEQTSLFDGYFLVLINDFLIDLRGFVYLNFSHINILMSNKTILVSLF